MLTPPALSGRRKGMSIPSSPPTIAPLRVATWNINSVRLREGTVLRFLEEQGPDVLCLQETKSPDDAFPHAGFEAAGYVHRHVRGQKGYNGVAILSKHPLEPLPHRDFCGKGDCRHIAARVGGVVVHNFYVPAGGDVPDREANEKFGHKLDFLAEMRDWFAGVEAPDGPSILVGDLNIAPQEQDVWSHKQLLKVVSHTPVEVDALEAVRASRDWVDVAREFVPPEEKLYSWWSYRSKNWDDADKGRRLDHIWITPDLRPALRGCETLRAVRGWEKPSDHAPVVMTLAP